MESSSSKSTFHARAVRDDDAGRTQLKVESSAGPPLTAALLRPRAAFPSEIRAWGALCARGFAHRGGDPERFYKRWCADPTGVAEGIRVTLAPDGSLVGSVRVFDRVLDVNGRRVRCAGLGEVCTDPAYRGQGVTSVMLPDAMAYCESSSAHLSSLHAAPGVQSLYAKYGYLSDMRVPYQRLAIAPPSAAIINRDAAVAAPRVWTDLEHDGAHISMGDGLFLRPARLHDDWAALNAMHIPFLRLIGATGFLHREPAEGYWTRWLQHMAGNAYYVLQRGSSAGATPPVPIAYAAIMFKPEGWKLGDFGVAMEDGGSGFIPRAPPAQCLEFVRAATLAAIQRARLEANDDGSHSARSTVAQGEFRRGDVEVPATVLLVPTLAHRWLMGAAAAAAASSVAAATVVAVAAAAASNTAGDIGGAASVDDVGWMVRPLHPNAAADDERERSLTDCEALQAAASQGRMLVWLADAF